MSDENLDVSPYDTDDHSSITAEQDAAAEAEANRILAELAGKEPELPGQPAPPPVKELDHKGIAHILKKREEVQREREEARRERDLILQEARQAREEAARQKAEFERQVQFLQRLRSDPVKAVREAGWDPEEFVNSLANAADPATKEKEKFQTLEEQIKEFHEWRESLLVEHEKLKERHQQYQYEQFRTKVESEFLAEAQNEEAYPAVSIYYHGNDRLLVQEGDAIADEYRALTGKEATLEDILEVLDERAKEKLERWQTRKASVKSPTKVPSGSVKSPLTQSSASSRETTRKGLAQMSEAEREAFAEQEANRLLKGLTAQ